MNGLPTLTTMNKQFTELRPYQMHVKPLLKAAIEPSPIMKYKETVENVIFSKKIEEVNSSAHLFLRFLSVF
jgi:hypothetical protein